MISVENEYFAWLLDKIDRYDDHILLLRELFLKEFYSILPKDDNRSDDGRDLRVEFFEETKGKGTGMPSGPCRFLEMLYALARRCENDIMHDDEKGDRTTFWFWMMIENMGFLQYTDDKLYIDSTYSSEIDEVLNGILDRKYESDGSGGLFPLKHPEKDQKSTEIWYQMNAFLKENFLVKIGDF